MTRYQLVWTTTAEEQLAAVWMAAANRTAVAAAADWLEQRLTRAPLQLGRPRSSSVQRVAYRAPLGVEFEVIEDDKRVVVQGVFAPDTP